MKAMQKILKFLLPGKVFQEIRKESKKWFIECEKCGFSKSYWETGGVRAYATRRKWIFGYCPICQRYKFLKVTKREPSREV